MAGTNEEMLINLESPEKNSNFTIHNHYLKNPLIPGPDLNSNELESNNPFDCVAQSAENWDPFELVLHQSLMHYEKNEYYAEKSVNLVDGEFSLGSQDNYRINRSNSVSNNIKFFPTSEKRCEKSDETVNICSRSLDNSPSLREKIKRVVKKRVNKCIERALNGNTSHADLNKNDIPSKKMFQNNILSNTDNENRFVKQKKVEVEDYDLKHFLEEAKQLSVIFHNLSVTDEGKTSPTMDNLARDHLKTKVSLLEEDLMSVRPPWDEIENDSSESDDSNIGLPKVKLYYMKKKDKERKNELDTEKLAHYKKRIRASIDGNMSCDEDGTTLSEVISKNIKSHEQKTHENQESLLQQFKGLKPDVLRDDPKETEEHLELIVTNKVIVPATNELKIKKVGNILKKGPLKAIVPLQKMTKTIAEKMSPLKRNSPSYKIKEKSNEDNTLSSSLIYPVATSTPNSKNLSSYCYKSDKGTPLGSKPRLSRKDAEQTGSTRRSVSLCTEGRRSSQLKQPFSSINPNNNQKWKRPHTAPSPNTKQTLKSSPKFKKSVLQKKANKVSALDKENRMDTY